VCLNSWAEIMEVDAPRVANGPGWMIMGETVQEDINMEYNNAMLTFLSRASKQGYQSIRQQPARQPVATVDYFQICRPATVLSASVQHTPSTNTIRSL
jgi:hypothetical protein